MHVISLQSGSNGNCIYVEAGGVKLLFDAGISGKQAKERLALHGRDICQVQAVLISHDHIDHTRCMGVLHRKFKLPVYVTDKTYQAAQACHPGAIADLRHFQSGEKIRFGSVTVETISTPHDCVDGVAFIVDDGTHRLGILTDLGHVFTGLEAAIASLDAVLLESNYDPDMLEFGPYPWALKERIRGGCGHLSNHQAARLLLDAASPRMRWACLAHLSHDNNTPTLARDTHQEILGDRLPIHVATRYEVSAVMEV